MMKNKERILNLTTASALSIFILYLSQTFGELMAIVQIFPFILLYLNNGWKDMLVSLVITSVISLIFMEMIPLAYMMFFSIFASFLFAILYKKKEKFFNIVTGVALVKIIVYVILIFTFYYLYRKDPFLIVKTDLNSAIDSFKNSITQDINYSYLKKEDLDFIVGSMRSSIDLLVELIPAMIFIGSYIISFINIWLCMIISKKTGKKVKYITKLNLMSDLDEMKKATLILGCGSILSAIIGGGRYIILTKNMVFVLVFLYLINGLGVLDFIYERSKKKIGRFLIPFIMLVLLRGYFIYVIVGFLDMFINLRRRIIINGTIFKK